jgi:diadenosine tetraphosphatase ApaH/serine/threonine PP2A family protein phosphatase
MNDLRNPKHRGLGYRFGVEALGTFLKDNKLTMMCRAHECVRNGYRWGLEGKLVTVFSAPNYDENNFAAIMKVSPGGKIGFYLFRNF